MFTVMTYTYTVYICKDDEIGGQWVEPWKGCNFVNTNTTKLMFGGLSKGEICVHVELNVVHLVFFLIEE